MSAWLEAYEKLPEAQKVRVQRWIHLQKFISETLGVPFETWIETYVGGAMAAPFDYSFMQVTVPGFSGLETDGATFSREVDPATARTSRVPLGAKNQLGRLSPTLQEAIGARLESAEPTDPAPVPPADVVVLQKVFPGEKALARLKRKDFRRVRLGREGDRVYVGLDGDAERLLELPLHEFTAVMKRPKV